MNRRAVFTAAAIVCVAALIVGTGLVILRELGKRGVPGFLDNGKYTVGGASLDAAVENLDIDWTDGSVTIAYHGRNTVEIAETARGPLSEKETLRWRLDGTTLRIRYAEPTLFSVRSLKKDLTVTLPEGVALGEVSIDATSADVVVPELRTGAFAADLTSGDLRAVLESPRTVTVSATSGKVELEQRGDADSVRLSGTSGDFQVSLGTVGTLRASTTSGTVRVGAASAADAGLESTSGTIAVALGSFRRLDIETTSGTVTAAIPSRPGFRAEIDTTSGVVESDIALKRSGSSYSCGDGSADVEIDTTSGSVHLTEWNG